MSRTGSNPLAPLLLPPPPEGRPTRTSDVPGYAPWLAAVSPELRWDWPHLALVRKHLADVTRGACKKLILSLPPQHGKSEGLTVRYPVWRLERDGGHPWGGSGVRPEPATGRSVPRY